MTAGPKRFHGRDDLRDVSAPPDRSVAGVRWHDQPAIWIRAVDGFRNRLWRLATRGAPTPIELPVSVDFFHVTRDGSLVYAGGDFDRMQEGRSQRQAQPAEHHLRACGKRLGFRIAGKYWRATGLRFSLEGP
jgi:hypothetical protein